MDSKLLAKKTRIKSLIMTSEAKASHIGSILSVVDILSVLYAKVIKIEHKNGKVSTKDKVILSKGHAGLSQILCLSEMGFFDKNLVDTYYKNEGSLSSFKSRYDGVDFLSSSLGQGLSVAVGLALAQKMNNEHYKTYAILGDGECNEGAVWEAVMFAVQNKLDNLVIIVDCNKFQAMGATKNIINLDLGTIFSSFGANVKEIDGHNHTELYDAVTQIGKGKPFVIIANTIKGKGVSFMEKDNSYHYSHLNLNQLNKAINEMEKNSEK